MPEKERCPRTLPCNRRPHLVRDAGVRSGGSVDMAFMDWIKGREQQPNYAIRTVWQGNPFTAHVSRYRAQACLGMSDAGYHAGLTLTPPGGEAKTTWQKPIVRRDEAMEQSCSAFVDWVDHHEARQRGIVDGKVKRPAPSWER